MAEHPATQPPCASATPGLVTPRHMHPEKRVLFLALAACACIALFMTMGVKGNWDFVLPLRGRKVLIILLVAYAVGVSAVLFQTATENRILTPAIMGFDALYVLIQSILIFLLGAQGVLALDNRLLFAGQVIIMVAVSCLLYWALLSSRHRNLHQLILAGVVLGILFHSLSAFIQRMINPSEYAFLQDRFFASLNNPDEDLLWMSALAILAASIWGLRWMGAFDVLLLGRDTAINLGVNHRRKVLGILVTVGILTSVSTALVGPITFFGLLVSHLAYALVRSHRHTLLLPAAALIGVICLAGGQVILERAFGFDANLRIIIDFLGGVLLILLLIRGNAK